jgi:hypothetical protein
LVVQNSLIRSQIYSGHCFSFDRSCVVEGQHIKHNNATQAHWQVRGNLVGPVSLWTSLIAMMMDHPIPDWISTEHKSFFFQKIFHPPKR